jgi:hydrogenase large subunit
VPCAINIDQSNAINAERLAYVGKLLKDAHEFIEKVYIPDLMAVASFYKNWAAIGGGLENYLAYGDLPTNGFADVSSFKFPRGIIMGRNLSEVLPVDARDPEQIQEFISHSYYDYKEGNDAGLHPWVGETALNYSGPKPPYDFLNVDSKYLAEDSPLERQSHGSRPPGQSTGRVCIG